MREVIGPGAVRRMVADGTLSLDADDVAVVLGDADADRLGLGRWRPGRAAR